jgi:hypothetical protein
VYKRPVTTFIVGLATDESGRISGIVGRVRTGEKERFHALGAVPALLRRMAPADDTQPGQSR